MIWVACTSGRSKLYSRAPQASWDVQTIAFVLSCTTGGWKSKIRCPNNSTKIELVGEVVHSGRIDRNGNTSRSQTGNDRPSVGTFEVSLREIFHLLGWRETIRGEDSTTNGIDSGRNRSSRVEVATYQRGLHCLEGYSRKWREGKSSVTLKYHVAWKLAWALRQVTYSKWEGGHHRFLCRSQYGNLNTLEQVGLALYLRV